MVDELGNVTRREALSIHKVLETHITRFLEHHCITKTLPDHLIDFSLKGEESLDKLDWVLDQGLILHNLLSILHNVRIHSFDDQSKGAFFPLKDVV